MLTNSRAPFSFFRYRRRLAHDFFGEFLHLDTAYRLQILPRFSASTLSAGSFSALAKALRRITNKPECVQHRGRIQVGKK